VTQNNSKFHKPKRNRQVHRLFFPFGRMKSLACETRSPEVTNRNHQQSSIVATQSESQAGFSDGHRLTLAAVLIIYGVERLCSLLVSLCGEKWSGNETSSLQPEVMRGVLSGLRSHTSYAPGLDLHPKSLSKENP